MEINLEELRKHKLMVCTPMYGDICTGNYARSMMQLTGMFVGYGLVMTSYYVNNDSLITRARNNCVDEFMKSDDTHLMFIDADIGFRPEDVLAMWSMSVSKNYDILAGVYPKKILPTQLVFNPLVQGSESEVMTPAEVLETGTGFMLIRRQVFDKFKEAFPERKYISEPTLIESQKDGTAEVFMFFQAEIRGNRYLSEDYNFCQQCGSLGIKVHVCPWVSLSHTGTHVFTGSLIQIAKEKEKNAIHKEGA